MRELYMIFFMYLAIYFVNVINLIKAIVAQMEHNANHQQYGIFKDQVQLNCHAIPHKTQQHHSVYTVFMYLCQ